MLHSLESEHLGLISMTETEMEVTEGGKGFVQDYLIGKAVDIFVDYIVSGSYARTLTNLGTSASNASMMFN